MELSPGVYIAPQIQHCYHSLISTQLDYHTVETMPPKRASYDAAFKLKVKQKANDFGSNRRAAEYFGVNEKQVREWRKSGDKLRKVQKTAKRLEGAGRPVACKQLDEKLIAWLKDSRVEGHAISGMALQLEERRITDGVAFKASNGWLSSFKARHGLSTRQGTSIGQKLPKDASEKLERVKCTPHTQIRTSRYLQYG